jgi:hypothetical protein
MPHAFISGTNRAGGLCKVGPSCQPRGLFILQKHVKYRVFKPRSLKPRLKYHVVLNCALRRYCFHIACSNLGTKTISTGIFNYSELTVIKPGICILITQFQDKDPFKEDPNTEVNIGTVQVRRGDYLPCMTFLSSRFLSHFLSRFLSLFTLFFYKFFSVLIIF